MLRLTRRELETGRMAPRQFSTLPGRRRASALLNPLKIKGKWHYLYRAVDKKNNTIDFLLTEKRDKKTTKRFFVKAIENNGVLAKITIDKSGANKAAIEAYNSKNNTEIEIRQTKYLNNAPVGP
jgi:VCBS repeat-containing protein